MADGAPGPANPLSLASNVITAFIDGQAATISFAGLAPGLIGLDQINVQIPTGVRNGNVTLEIDGPDYITIESSIPIAGGTTAATSVIAPRPMGQRKGPRVARRRNPQL